MRAAILVLVAGCAHTAVHRRYLDRYEAPTIVGRAEELTLEARVAGDRLHVVAQRPRRCYREVHETEEAVRTREGDTGNGEGFNGRDGAAIGAVLAVLTMAQVIADHPTTTIEDHVVDRVDEACPLPETRLPVTVELPSGANFDATTDLAGMIDVALPAGEHGTLTVRAGDVVAQATF